MPGRSVVTSLHLNVAGYLGPLKAAAAGTKEFAGEFDKAATKGGRGFDQLAAGAAITGAGILAGFGVAVKSAMEFDKQMSHVGAAANATGKDLDALRESALQAGADTAFSAREAAQGQEELAKAGVSVKDILGGGLKGALDLAAAGTLEVGEAAEIAATALVQFKLSGADVPHIADLLSAAANKAQGSVHDVGAALKMSGLVASQFGLSIEETVGSLAAFASAGLIGSDAGTSLKQSLLMLGNPTEKSAALMKKLGISAYDASGNFVGMANLAQQLRDQLGGLTQEQRNAALATIFGADAIRAASVLYDNGAAGIRKWTQEVDDSGNAGRTAAAKMDNLAGDLERLKGSLDTALIQTGSQSTGVLRVLAQAAENTVSGFTELPGPLKAVATILLLMTGGALAAAGAYGIMAPKVREASAALVGMGAAGRVTNTAMIGIGKGVGIALAAIAALQIAGAAMADTSVRSSGDVDRLGKSLADFGRTGKVSGEMTDVLGGKMGRLNNDLVALERDGFAGFGVGFASAIEKITATGNLFDDSTHNSMRRIGELDAALAQLATSGHADEAKAAFDRLAAAGKEQGVNVNELSKGLPLYTSAAKDVADAAAKSGGSMEAGAKQAKTLAGGMAEAVKEAGSLADALAGLNDVNIDAVEAGISFQLSMNGLTKELRENKGAWAGNTDAALNNRQAVIDRITAGQDFIGKQHEQTTATRGATAADAEATAAHRTMRTAMINAAVAAGINRGAVTALIDQLFRVPKDTRANISVPGAKPSIETVQTLDQKIKALRDKQVQVRESGAAGAWRQVKALQEQINALQSKRVTISSTFIRTTIERHQETFNITKRWGGIIDHAAAGGRLEAHMVNSPTVLYGERETGGEAYVPRIGNPARSKAIVETAASWYGGAVQWGGGASYAGAVSGNSSAGGRGPTVVNVTVPNYGVIGSRSDLRDWLAGEFDVLARKGRV